MQKNHKFQQKTTKMKENQMNLEQMCAMINEMHKELETLKQELHEERLKKIKNAQSGHIKCPFWARIGP